MADRELSNHASSRKPRAKQLGVTDEQYAAMLARQGGGCAICGHPPKTRRLHVDHDHKTGRVRGLLCFQCNRLLLIRGMTAHRLLSAAEYLLGPDRYVYTYDPATDRYLRPHSITP